MLPLLSWATWCGVRRAVGLGVLSLVLASVVGASAARATPIFELVFVSTTGAGMPGTDSISAAPGDILTAELRLTAGAEGVSSYAISLEFDADLLNELDLVSVSELLPAGFAFALTPDALALEVDSSATTAGRLYSFEAFALGEGPVSSTFAVGVIEFRVGAAVAADGTDLAIGFFHVGVDGIFDNAGGDAGSRAVLGSGSVNPVPEPRMVQLVLLALLAIRLRRRSRG